MGVQANWESYIALTRAKADSHGEVAQYWDTVHNSLNMLLIFLSAATTMCTLLPVNQYIPAGLGAATTLVSAISGFMAPSNRRQAQMESSRAFRSLMLKMVRCESEREYEELWKEYNKELLSEPFLPKKYKVKAETNFSMSPEFVLLVTKKEASIAGQMACLSFEGGSMGSNKYPTSTRTPDVLTDEESEDRNSDTGDKSKLIQSNDR